MNKKTQQPLEARAHSLLLSGEGRQLEPSFVVASPGFNESCRLCGEPIGHDEIGYELTWRDGAMIPLHSLPCYGIFDAERVALAGVGKNGS